MATPLMVLTACHGGHRAPSPAFGVESAQPAESALDQPLAAPLRIAFTAPVDRLGLDAGTVSLRGVTGVVAIDLVYDDASRTLEVVPSRPLLAGASYTLHVSGALRSAAGVALGADFELSFGTADRRVWRAVEAVPGPGAGAVEHAVFDPLGGLHLLLSDAPVGSGTARYARRQPDGGWAADELLGPLVNAFGFDVAPTDSSPAGVVRGAVLAGYPGATVRRDATLGTWDAPIAIPLQSPPAEPLSVSRWPDPRHYRWVAGASMESALRVGPLVPTLPGDGGTRCKLITATTEIDCAYPPTRSIWTARVGPAGDAWVIGVRSIDRGVLAWRPDASDGTSVRIGEVPLDWTPWDAQLSSNAFGHAIAAWMLVRLPGDVRTLGQQQTQYRGPGDTVPQAHLPGAGPVPGATFEARLMVARFDPSRGWTEAETVATFDSASTLIVHRAAIAANGDALVGWRVSTNAGATRALHAAHYRAPASGVSAPGWSRLLLSDSAFDMESGFAVAQDPSGHTFIAWVEGEYQVGPPPRYDQVLRLRRFDPRRGWLDAEVVAVDPVSSAGRLSLRDVHLATDAGGQLELVWVDSGGVWHRRFG